MKSSPRSSIFDKQGKSFYGNEILVDSRHCMGVHDFILVFDPVCICMFVCICACLLVLAFLYA